MIGSILSNAEFFEEIYPDALYLDIRNYSSSSPEDLEDRQVVLLLPDYFTWYKVKDILPLADARYSPPSTLSKISDVYEIYRRLKENPYGDLEEIRNRISLIYYKVFMWVKGNKDAMRVLYDFHKGKYKQRKLSTLLSQYESYPGLYDWWLKNHDSIKEEEIHLWESLYQKK